MLITFGVWSNVSNVDNIKTLEYESDEENKFTFTSMLETDPEEWETTLEGYNDFVGEYVIFDAETNTLTLRNIRVTGDKWIAHEYYSQACNINMYRCINLHKNIKHIIMEDSVSLPGNYIPSYAFIDNSGLESIRIPNTVTSIGGIAYDEDSNEAGEWDSYGAFELCTSLTSVTIESREGSVTTIGNYAFGGCTSLTSVTIPGSVTTIGNDAFNGCTLLTSVTIPGSVTTIGDYAFNYCTSLTSVTIPGSVTTIGEGAFSSCTSLTSVTIPGSVTTIGNYAFSSCTSLTSVTIPGSVTTIGDSAFELCTSLTTMLIPSGCSIGYDAFYNCTSLTTMLIPSGCAINDDDRFDGMSKLTYVITTDKFIYKNYEKIFGNNTSINISITDNDTIYHIYTKSNGTVKYAESTELSTTPAAIEPYVTNSSIDTTDTKVYQYTLEPDTNSVSATSKIKITESKVYQSVVLVRTTDYDYNDYYNISSAPTTYTSPNIILDVSDFNIPYSANTSYKATIITSNTSTETLSVTITPSHDNTTISTITIPSLNTSINNYILITPVQN